MCASVCGCAWVCASVHTCMWVDAGVSGWVLCARVCMVCVEVRRCLRVCVLDEFSEYLLETRVNTSADFNTYPIRIFSTKLSNV